jgi:hypothetical protein
MGVTRFAEPALAGWWIVRSSDKKYLIVEVASREQSIVHCTIVLDPIVHCIYTVPVMGVPPHHCSPQEPRKPRPPPRSGLLSCVTPKRQYHDQVHRSQSCHREGAQHIP